MPTAVSRRCCTYLPSPFTSCGRVSYLRTSTRHNLTNGWEPSTRRRVAPVSKSWKYSGICLKTTTAFSMSTARDCCWTHSTTPYTHCPCPSSEISQLLTSPPVWEYTTPNSSLLRKPGPKSLSTFHSMRRATTCSTAKRSGNWLQLSWVLKTPALKDALCGV